MIILITVQSQAVASCCEKWTLDQLICTAIRENKDLMAARFAIDKAQGRLIQAGKYSNPRLNVGRNDDSLFNDEGEYQQTVSISQDFPVAGRIARQKQVTRVELAIAAAEVNEAERKLIGEVSTRYYRMLVLDQQMMVREQLARINKKLVVATKARHKAAEVSELDVNTASIELQRITQERVILKSQWMNELAELSRLLGRPACEILDLEKCLDPDELPPLCLLQEEAINTRPDLRSAWLTGDRLRAEEALARAQRWEDWTVQLGYQQEKTVIEGAPPQNADRFLTVNVSIPLPLLNRNQGKIHEAKAGQYQVCANVEALKLTINNQIASNYQAAERLSAAIRQYQSTILPASIKNIALAQQGYNQGQTSIQEVVLIQRQFGELKIAYLNTLDQYFQALVSLRAGVGYQQYLTKEFPCPKERVCG